MKNKKHVFQSFVCNQTLEDSEVGESGFILINPNPRTEEEFSCSLLCETHFIVSVDLMFFETKNQAKKYRDIHEWNHLLMVAIKRVGPGLTGQDFEYDVSVDEESQLASFQIIKGFDSSPFLNSSLHICFEKPEFDKVELTMDEYLSYLDKDSKELISDLKTKLRKRNGLKSLTVDELKEELIQSEDRQDYEYSAKIRDEISKR